MEEDSGKMMQSEAPEISPTQTTTALAESDITISELSSGFKISSLGVNFSQFCYQLSLTFQILGR